MAKNKTQEKPKKVLKVKKNTKTNKQNARQNARQNSRQNAKQNAKQNTIKKSKCVNENSEINNGSVLELMTKYPELNQTFEYILYSNKYKHTLTDVCNIIKMLMSKLEELQKHDVDLKNNFETINLNYKIKGLVQSTAINLSHVVEQLNTNESMFLNFARSFSQPRVTNDNEEIPENILPNFTNVPMVLEEPIVSSMPMCSHSSSPREIKLENKTDKPNTNTNIFGSNFTIILSSDDEYEESISYDVSNVRSVTETRLKRKNVEDLESYVIGADIKDILSDHDNSNNEVIFSPRQSQDNSMPKYSSKHMTPVQKVRKVKQKISDEVINEARKSDFRLRKRLNERNCEMLKLVRELNLQPNDIVLEFDTLKKQPVITIQKELAKVLKKHQVEGVRFLWNTVFESVLKTNTTDGTGSILAHRMGIGKTLQIITLMYTLLCHSQINIKTFLIICPPGLIYNWMDEIYKWLKDIDKNEIVKVYDLPKTNKLYNITNIATWKSKGGILIISYENFKSLVNCNQSDLRESFSHALIDPGPDVVVLDEGHYIKNTNTILLRSLKQIRTKRRIVLTGTPMQNSLKEYYTLVDFVKPNILGNFGDFSSIFIKPIDSGQFLDSSDEAVKIMKQRTFTLHKLLHNTVHRIDDRNLKPLFTEKIEYTIEVNMTEFQSELYEKYLYYNKTANDSCNVFSWLHVLTLITLHPLTLYRLIHYRNSKQPEFRTAAIDEKFVKDLTWIANYGEDPRFFDAKQSNKIMYLLTAIDKCQKNNEKVLCFLKSPLALDALEYFLQKERNWNLGEHYLRMDGKTPLSIRNQMCEAFNNSENTAKLFILSLGTGVLGYNMVGANRVLLLSTSWNPSNDMQAIYRCLRFGQKKTVYVNRLLAKGTVEPKAYYRQISKLGMASSVVDLQHMSRKVSYEQTNDLFTFDPSIHYSTLTPNTKDPILNQLIMGKVGSISSIKEHDSMLVESVEEQLSVEERRAIWLSFKKNELGVKNVIKPKTFCKVPNFEQHNTKKKSIVINEDIKHERENYTFDPTNNFQHEEQQIYTQNAQESHSSRYHSYFNNSKPSTGTHTKFSDTATIDESTNSTTFNSYNSGARRNHWRSEEPIQNQFRNFQNKTFSHHKRYSTPKYHPHSFRRQNSYPQNNEDQPSPNQHQNKTWYPNHRTPTDNNIQNRSGMSR